MKGNERGSTSPMSDEGKRKGKSKRVSPNNTRGKSTPQDSSKEQQTAQNITAHQQQFLRPYLSANQFPLTTNLNPISTATQGAHAVVSHGASPPDGVNSGAGPSGLQPSVSQSPRFYNIADFPNYHGGTPENRNQNVHFNTNGFPFPNVSKTAADTIRGFHPFYQQSQFPEQMRHNNNTPQFPNLNGSLLQNGSGGMFVNGRANSDEEIDEEYEDDEQEAPQIVYAHGEQFRQVYTMGEESDRKELLDELFNFMQAQGTPINRVPIMAKNPLDLYKLFKLVVARGGILEVVNKKLWREITKGLNLPSTITSAAFTLRTQYCRYLYTFECKKYNLSRPTDLQAAVENNKREGKRNTYVFDMSQGIAVSQAHMGGLPLAMFPQNTMSNTSLLNQAMLSTFASHMMNARGFAPQLPPMTPHFPYNHAAMPSLPIHNIAPVRMPQPLSTPPGECGGLTFAPPEAPRESAFIATSTSGQRRSSSDSDGPIDYKKNKVDRSPPAKQDKVSDCTPEEGEVMSRSPPIGSSSIVSFSHCRDEVSNEEQMAVKMTINGILYEGVLRPQRQPHSSRN